ncbi:MAG TPA: hypothetical protein VMX97_13715 [Hyphomicrobiaceae bacterium]|nr:hypothetical protein [Hyphomicrobiaceae bacterium]
MYGEKDNLVELFEAVRKVAPWANDKDAPMTDGEIALTVRRAVAMGLDPLNAHEVQIWKDKRGSVNFDISYILRIEWVRHFHGEHTEPQYRRLTAEELEAEGLLPQDVAYRVTFLMKKDLPGLSVLIQAGYDPTEARAMLEVSGLGVSLASEYNGQYFASSGRSKSWKVQKRALTDAYRRKFGDPTRFEIEELRRVGGLSNLRPGDWEDGAGLADSDAVTLAKSNAAHREHAERMQGDPEYHAEHVAQDAEANSAMWGAPPVVVEVESKSTPLPSDIDPVEAALLIARLTIGEQNDLDPDAEAALVAGLVEEAETQTPSMPLSNSETPAPSLPPDCPTTNWSAFLKYVITAGIGYTANMHAVNTLKKELGGDDANWEPWSGARINGDPARFWTVLIEHAANKQA